MGGVVVSMMAAKNKRSLCVSKDYENYQKIGQQGVPVLGTEISNGSAIYRIAGYNDKNHKKACMQAFTTPNHMQLLNLIRTQRPKRRAIAYRVVDCVKEETQTDVVTGKRTPVNVTYFKETVYMDFETFWETLTSFGRGLVKLGVTPRSNVAVYKETCWEWLATAYGIWTQDMILVTVYADLGEDSLSYALREAESAAVVCDAKNAQRIVDFMSNGRSRRAPIVYIGTLPPHFVRKGLAVYEWSQVVLLGRAAGESIPVKIPTDNDSVSLVMYTSGTTGNPKGVVHTHRSLAAGGTAIKARFFDNLGPFQEGETYCAYLPLAYIIELILVNIFFYRGTLVCFGTPGTLTQATARPHGDFVEFNPVLVAGGPIFFDTLKKTIEAKLPPPGNLKRKVFDQAFKDRLNALKEGKDTPYWNKEVFALPRALLGLKFRMFLTGGACLSAATQDFVNVVLGPIVQGWGFTETLCMGSLQRRCDLETLCEGQFEPTEDVRLLDTEDFKHTDQPEPRGELLLRGPFLFKGYYKQEKLTAEAVDKDGWFHTGDVGSITKEGKLRFVGRIKTLAKNVLEECIGMEVLESIYSQNPLCMPNGVCVLVHPDRSYITALVLALPKEALKFAKVHNIDGDFDELLKKDEFHVKVAESLVETAKAANRRPFEYVKFVRVLADEWTPENGLLTPTSKIRRLVMEERYAEVVSKLFSKVG